MSTIETGPLASLRTIEPFSRVDGATLETLHDELSVRRLAPREVVVEAGTEAGELLVVIDGSLGVEVPTDDGPPVRLAELGAGSVVGEVAVLLGGRRTAAVVALTETTVVELTAAGVGTILAAAPHVAFELTEQATRRLREAQLAGHVTRLFGRTSRSVLDELLGAVEHVQLLAGATLFVEGDVADAAYVVLSGRLRASRTTEDGHEVLGELGPGELVGELALLDEDRRGADIVAVRDSALARLPRAMFDELVSSHPTAMLAVTRRLIARTRAPARTRGTGERRLSIAVVPQSPDVDLRAFTNQFVAALGDGTRHLWAARVDSTLHRPGLAQSEIGGPDDARLTHWLHEVEQRHPFLVYEADPTWTPWTARACRQADEVLIVAPADAADPGAGPLEQELARSHETGHTPRRTLVLLHGPQVDRPAGTASWLDARSVDRHVHLRREDRRDHARLARLVAGTSTTLVLGGGGARGTAHLGVLRALREGGVDIDAYGGTSIGSVMALAAALEWPHDDLVPHVSRIMTGLLDYTLPVVSLLKGRRISDAIAEAAGGRDIEDLWSDYFCVSTNLTRQVEVVHRRGDLSRAVRASVAIPGVLPPVAQGDDLLIDGASMNNLPVDRAREANPTGTVIAVDVAPPRGPSARSEVTAISGWGQIARRVTPGRRPVRVPGIVVTMLGSTIVAAMRDRNAHVRDQVADLYLDLDLRGHGLLDFDATAAIAAAGYEAAKPRVEAWLAAGGGDGDAAVPA